MKRESAYRNLFVLAALWNWGAAVVFFFLYGMIFSMLGMALPNYPSVLRLFLALVFAFGVGYWWVSRDLERNRDIVRMGILAKTLVFVIMLYYWLQGELPALILATGVVDLIFAALFLQFLMKTGKTSR
jgi:hypothetical protein